MTSLAITVYWFLGGAAFVAFAAVSLAPLQGELFPGKAATGWWTGRAAYGLLMLLSLFLLRWPAFFVGRPLDPDEGQFIAGALTLGRDPVFWRSLDGQSAGPLVYYALLPLVPGGLANYGGARLVGCLMVFGTLWFSYRGLRAVWGEGLARLAVLPAFGFLALSTHSQFVGYSSEHVSVLLLAIGLCGLLTGRSRAVAGLRCEGEWVVAGVALGAIPFAKLQAVPPAAVLFLGGVLWAATRREWTSGQRVRKVLVLVAGLWVVPLGFAATFSMTEVWEDFWISYLRQNAAYTGDGWSGLSEALAGVWPFLMSSRAFGSLAVAAVGVAAVWGLRRAVFRSPSRRALGLLAAFVVATAPVCVSTRHYQHYLLFLVMPLTLLAGAVVATQWQIAEGVPVGRAARRRWLVGGLLALTVAPQVAIKVLIGNPYLAEIAPGRCQPILGPVAREILRLTVPGDCLVVWGWWAEPYVQTGLPQGTREAISPFQIIAGPEQAYHRRRYLDDLRKNQPRVFVDAVAPAPGVTDFFDRRRFGHETFPALRELIAHDYELAAEIEGVRIYRRRSARNQPIPQAMLTPPKRRGSQPSDRARRQRRESNG